MRNGISALLVCIVLASMFSNTPVETAAAANKSFTTGNVALEIDGQVAGFVSSAEGGLAFGDVVKVAGEDFFFKKQLGNSGYRDIRLEIGTGVDKSVFNVIALALQGQPVQLNGALLRTDHNFNVTSRLEFFNAQITEVTFPAADATSKDPFRVSIVLSPGHTSFSRGTFGKVAGGSITKPKVAITSSYRLSIDGLMTKRVTKVEALTIKLPRMNFGGDNTDCINCAQYTPITPARVDFPHVVMTLPELDAGPVYNWFDDFVLSGNNEDSQEKGGTLEFLTPNLQAPLFTIKFKNLGIFELAPVVGSADNVARLMAAMYCEAMEFVAH